MLCYAARNVSSSSRTAHQELSGNLVVQLVRHRKLHMPEGLMKTQLCRLADSPVTAATHPLQVVQTLTNVLHDRCNMAGGMASCERRTSLCSSSAMYCCLHIEQMISYIHRTGCLTKAYCHMWCPCYQSMACIGLIHTEQPRCFGINSDSNCHYECVMHIRDCSIAHMAKR